GNGQGAAAVPRPGDGPARELPPRLTPGFRHGRHRANGNRYTGATTYVPSPQDVDHHARGPAGSVGLRRGQPAAAEHGHDGTRENLGGQDQQAGGRVQGPDGGPRPGAEEAGRVGGAADQAEPAGGPAAAAIRRGGQGAGRIPAAVVGADDRARGAAVAVRAVPQGRPQPAHPGRQRRRRAGGSAGRLVGRGAGDREAVVIGRPIRRNETRPEVSARGRNSPPWRFRPVRLSHGFWPAISMVPLALSRSSATIRLVSRVKISFFSLSRIAACVFSSKGVWPACWRFTRRTTWKPLPSSTSSTSFLLMRKSSSSAACGLISPRFSPARAPSRWGLSRLSFCLRSLMKPPPCRARASNCGANCRAASRLGYLSPATNRSCHCTPSGTW